MRWHLASHALPFGTFSDIRHAHSHLGYYGVLFPLMWAAWPGLGAHTPGRKLRLLYALGTILATIGFVRAGYGPEAIVGSSLAGLTWLASAWTNRHRVVDTRSWLAPAPITIFLAVCCVPPIALTIRQHPVLSAQIVQTFLSLLLLGAIIPTALAVQKLPPPLAPLWAASAVAAALFLGVVPSGWAGAGLLLLAIQIVAALRREGGRLPFDVLLGWVGLTLGFLAMGSSLLPNTQPIAVAGVHFIILAPVLTSLGLRWAPGPVPPFLRGVHLVAVSGMCAAIALPGYILWAGWSVAAAWFGTVIAINLGVLALWWRRTSPTRAQPPRG